MSLQSEGFRFLMTKDGKDFGWIHPTSLNDPEHSDKIDCTEMPDAEFNAFVESCYPHLQEK